MIHVFADYAGLTSAAAEQIASLAAESVADHGKFTWLLSGGNTPQGVYRLLAEQPYRDLPFWAKTHIYWSDERCVGPDHAESNYGLAKRLLLDLVPIRPEQIHRIEGEDGDRLGVAERYGRILPAQPDLILLGLGADGHTASLFPGSAALYQCGKRATVAEAPVEPRWRITVTRPVLAAGRNILVLVAGADKAAALRRVFSPEGDIHETPARLVRNGTWFVDRAAADRMAQMGLPASLVRTQHNDSLTA